jgi:iron(III) transport system ATP-binding protein
MSDRETRILELKSLVLRFGRNTVVNGLTLDLRRGDIGCLLGPSGCGKTTVLRSIAGFRMPDQGEIWLDGRLVAGRGICRPPEQRGIGMVFQDFALFPHLTVGDNIRFGLRGLSAAGQRARVAELLALIGLPTLEKAWPHQLSGGQQQRVALARALAPRPSLLLLDEPFSSLDVDLREQLAREVRAILRQEGISGILVTHDQHEAFAMADSVCVLNEGALEQCASPYDLYHRPATRFVAGFIGEGVMIPGEVIAPGRVRTELGEIRGDPPAGCQPGCAVDVLIRPDDILHDDASPEKAVVVERAFRGSEFLYTLRMPSGVEVLSLVPSHHDHAIGEAIGIRLAVDHLVMFRRQ